jgi:hypothetical protein
MTTDDPVFHKPKSFIAAKNLLYAGIFLSVIVFILHNIRLTVRPKFLYWGWLVSALGYAIMIILIKQMGLCKKWARLVLTVWFSLGFVMVIISFFSASISMSIPEVAIWALKIVLQVIAFIFLYSIECENWFNSKKYEMFQK